MSTSNRSPFEQCALASGLLTEQDLDAARSSVRWSDDNQSDPTQPNPAQPAPGQPTPTEPDAAAPPSDQQLADRLVDMGKLNAWQGRQLLQGRTKFKLGYYLIVDGIGQGGMGQVFKAEHSILGRTVAIKVLPRNKSTPEAVASFNAEIRALARLEHPRLVRATDAGHDGNVYYLVTEYVPGTDLRNLVRRDGPLGMEQAGKIIYQVAEGLQYAHTQGVIHRDVKPGNVLVTPEGDAKLSDLGLSGPLDASAENDLRFGKVVGTADYISPDQIATPWQPTPAWDIYSLGCTLYYAVTGKVPFPGGTTADKARAHRELRPLHPRRLNPSLSTAFVDLIADMMAKDPAQRIPTAAEVLVRLTPWMPKPAPPPLPAGRAFPPQPALPTTPSAWRWATAPSAGPPPAPVIPPPAPVPNMADTAADFAQLPQMASADSDESSSLVLQTVESLAAPNPTWADADALRDSAALKRKRLFVFLVALAGTMVGVLVLLIFWLISKAG